MALLSEELSAEMDALDDALACIRAETRAGRLTPAAAAEERAGLLAAHLRRVGEIRQRHAPGPAAPVPAQVSQAAQGPAPGMLPAPVQEGDAA